MKKRKYYKRSGLLAVILLLSLFTVPVSAGTGDRIVDGSVLTYETESDSRDLPQTMGEYLLNGYCKIVNRGNGQIAAGGTTTADGTVERVGIGIIVERYDETDNAWGYYDSWQYFRENAMSASSSKILNVEKGYYYRVVAIHSANSDMSSSYTNGIYID